uniref:Sperm associated antigen 16 n=1 Tax=Equus asinus TaxID=9793 RepID=A0A9L0K5C3_EQUAS
MAAEEGMAPSALRVLEEALGVGLTSAGATAEAVAAEGAYYLEQVTITEASEDDYEYEEIPDDNFSIPEGEEDLAKAIHMVQEQAIDTHILEQKTVLPSKPAVPEVIEDFLCNFLIKMGMTRTLDCFQSEWLKLHYASYEPTIRVLHEKHHTLLKQKMLTSLERDRAVKQISGLQASWRLMDTGHDIYVPEIRVAGPSSCGMWDATSMWPDERCHVRAQDPNPGPLQWSVRT